MFFGLVIDADGVALKASVRYDLSLMVECRTGKIGRVWDTYQTVRIKISELITFSDLLPGVPAFGLFSHGSNPEVAGLKPCSIAGLCPKIASGNYESRQSGI